MVKIWVRIINYALILSATPCWALAKQNSIALQQKPSSESSRNSATLNDVIGALIKQEFSKQKLEVDKSLINNQSAAKRQNYEDFSLNIRSRISANRALYPWKDSFTNKNNENLNIGGIVLSHQNSLVLQKPIYDFNRLNLALDSLAKQERALELAQQAQEAEHFTNAAKILFRVKNAKMQYAALLPSLDIAQRKENAVRALFEAGQRPARDVLNAESALLRAQLQIQKAQYELMKSTQSAAAQTGLSEDAFTKVEPIQISNNHLQNLLQNITKSFPEDQISGPGRKVEQLRRQEIELRSSALQVEIEALSRNDYPMILGEAGTTWGGSLTPLQGDAFAAVTLNWTPPWPGKGNTEKTQLLLQKQKLQIQAEEISQAYVQRVKETKPVLAPQMAQWDLLEKQQTLLEKIEKLTQDRYKEGRATNLEVSAAESDLLTNTIDRARLLGDILESQLDYALANDNVNLVKEILNEK